MPRQVWLFVVIAIQLALLPFGIWRAWNTAKPASAAPNAALSTAAALLAGCVGALLFVLLGLAYDELMRLIVFAGSPTIGPWGCIRDFDKVPTVAAVVLAVTIGPASDELFYRGTVFGGLRATGRPCLGAAVSAVLFAVSRCDPTNFAAYVAIGLLLAGLYQRTGRLLSTWTAQAVTNSVMMALLFSGYE